MLAIATSGVRYNLTAFVIKLVYVGFYSHSDHSREWSPAYSARHCASGGDAPHLQLDSAFCLSGSGQPAYTSHAAKSRARGSVAVPAWLANALCGAAFGGPRAVGESGRAHYGSHRCDAPRDLACINGF